MRKGATMKMGRGGGRDLLFFEEVDDDVACNVERRRRRGDGDGVLWVCFLLSDRRMQ